MNLKEGSVVALVHDPEADTVNTETRCWSRPSRLASPYHPGFWPEGEEEWGLEGPRTSTGCFSN